ncbi:SapC family protein [Parvularcula marina]|uniref:Peptidase n=1 Tax=Parvularcula marina TaxID=2292771 RepID=A0A371RFU1_9PROT|nr:SapC family protein [Parvularcula marina]RFB04321.1 peptidase [Parvularcula marina]
MSTTPTATPPGLEGSMFLFSKPALLNKEQHGKLGVSRPDRPFAFAEKIRAIPLTVSEIPSASRDYPVIFSEKATALPLAVVGIIDDENLFIDKESGEWEQNVYVPGYLRRYPFALATDRGADPQNPRMAMIVDEGYAGITENGELPFFNNGEPSDAMKQAMEYCQTYEQDRQNTLRFSQELAKYDFLAEQVAQFTPDGTDQPQPFAKYVGLEENKLNELPDDKFLELRKSNILPILYSQLMSMGNWRALMERRARRHNLQGVDVLKSMKSA